MSAAGNYMPELAVLGDHEKVIEQGLATFVEVGWALLRIRDQRLYRAAGYTTFEDYCQQRWDLTRQHANRLIAATEIVDALEPTGSIPQSERQLRPLAPLRDRPEQAREAWAEAVEEAGGQPTARDVERAVARRLTPDRPPVTKPDLGGGVSHPARYSDELIPMFASLLGGDVVRVLDPFAGTGRIHELQACGLETVGVEIEPEWASLHPDTIVGNALDLPFDDGEFDAVCTSPTYGNRLADHHDAADPELRRSYTHDLGRKLHDANSGDLHWGPEYRAFHEDAWAEAVRVLRPGGRFILNIKDHIRGGAWQDVAGWHVAALCDLGLYVTAIRPVVTSALRQGANGELRVPAELVIAFVKDSGDE